MKYKIIEILFGWLTTPILHLNLMQVFIAFAEFIVMCWLVTITFTILKKIKIKREKGYGDKIKRKIKYTGYNDTREL